MFNYCFSLNTPSLYQSAYEHLITTYCCIRMYLKKSLICLLYVCFTLWFKGEKAHNHRFKKGKDLKIATHSS